VDPNSAGRDGRAWRLELGHGSLHQPGDAHAPDALHGRGGERIRTAEQDRRRVPQLRHGDGGTQRQRQPQAADGAAYGGHLRRAAEQST